MRIPLVRLSVFVLLAFLLGYSAGVLGTFVEHRNETHFGASYTRFRGEWLALPAFPGFMIAEWGSGFPWEVNEAWNFRHQVRLWNGAFWAFTGLLVAMPWQISRRSRALPASAGKLPAAAIRGRRAWAALLGLLLWTATLPIHLGDYRPEPLAPTMPFRVSNLYNWLPAAWADPVHLLNDPTALLALLVYAIPGLAYAAACYLLACALIYLASRRPRKR